MPAPTTAPSVAGNEISQPAPAARNACQTAPLTPAPVGELGIIFDNVSFAYDGGRRPALRRASFSIGVGQKVALVGPSGAGKSTVVNLLLRFVEPDQGLICVKGAPLGNVPVSVWRSQVAWVPQTPHLFHDTIAANIRLARPEAAQADVVRAAQRAQLHDFISALPQGYDTLVGENGARLSGGEAQRVALARAFLKDAPILVLDEPTSSVDPDLEARLLAATEELTRGRTVLLIAHRLSTVYQADQIIVLSEGRVVEAGQHAALLGHQALYRQLVHASLEAA